MTSSPTDQQLAEAMRTAQAGDGKAYHQLLTDIAPMIRGFIYKRLGNHSELEDRVQDVLLAIHRAGHTYNSDRSFLNWMFAIADYKVKDHLRSHYRRKAAGTQVDLETVAELSAPQLQLALEDRQQLDRLLETLSPRERTIIQMMKIEGHSARDVGNSLGMSEGAVKVAVHRAMKTLALQAQQEDSHANQ